MIIALTGHRPDKIGNEYDHVGKYSTAIFNELQRQLIIFKPERIITGMALGCDTLWALAALDLKIPVTAAIPFKGQESRWPKKSKDLYFNILANPLVTQYIVSSGGYSIEKMQIRNIWMCNNSDKLIAVWNGTAGGTKNCVDYAIDNKKDILFIEPEKLIKHVA